MPVLERLSDEEAYLVTILMDESGLDQAEFLWYDQSTDDGCFRAWPYQWTWWRCNHPQQIDQASRSVGKSLSIKVRGFAFAFVHPGQEMVITAPELVHLEPIVGLIENQVLATRLSRELLVKKRSAINHRPFMMNFENGARIIGRIPQRDGKGVKGIHPIWLELDEAQDFPKSGWTELVETLKRGFDGAVWRAHGVTRGVQDEFFKFTQQDKPDNPWLVHRIVAMQRPNWTDEERQAKIKQYGSREDPDYRRNVLGLHGDATNPLFVLRRLMQCVDTDESSELNLDDYYRVHIKDSELEYFGGRIEELLQFPLRHQRFDVTWCGMDVGFTADPSEILVFAEYHPDAAEIKADKKAGRAVPQDGLSRLKCIARITLQRISHPDQVAAIGHIIDFYKPRAFAMDKTGNGLPLFQAVQNEARNNTMVSPDEARRRLLSIKGYNFGEKVIVELDDTMERPVGIKVENEDIADAVGIKSNVLEHSTDVLREYVDMGRLFLPYDRELIAEFSGQTFSYSKGTMDAYGRRRRLFSEGRFHALDAARMAAMGHAQASIEAFVAEKPAQRPVLDMFVSA